MKAHIHADIILFCSGCAADKNFSNCVDYDCPLYDIAFQASLLDENDLGNFSTTYMKNAVRSRCVECMGGSPMLVRKCQTKKCPLHTWRVKVDTETTFHDVVPYELRSSTPEIGTKRQKNSKTPTSRHTKKNELRWMDHDDKFVTELMESQSDDDETHSRLRARARVRAGRKSGSD